MSFSYCRGDDTYYFMRNKDKALKATACINNYTYYSLNDNEAVNKSKIQYLREQRIFLSASSGFNDPFEGKFFKFDKDKLENGG